MIDQPTQSDLKSLLALIEEVQSKILQTFGPSEQIKKGWAAELDPLKAPVFFLWELLGYGTAKELSEKGVKRVWIDSKYQITSFLLMKSNSLCRSSSFAPFR